MVGHQSRREKCSHGLVSSAREERVSGTCVVCTQTQTTKVCISRQMKLSVDGRTYSDVVALLGKRIMKKRTKTWWSHKTQTIIQPSTFNTGVGWCSTWRVGTLASVSWQMIRSVLSFRTHLLYLMLPE
jgi:hypothetical protein